MMTEVLDIERDTKRKLLRMQQLMLDAGFDVVDGPVIGKFKTSKYPAGDELRALSMSFKRPGSRRNSIAIRVWLEGDERTGFIGAYINNGTVAYSRDPEHAMDSIARCLSLGRT